MTEKERMLQDIRDEMLDLLTSSEWNTMQKERYQYLVKQSIILLDEIRTA